MSFDYDRLRELLGDFDQAKTFHAKWVTREALSASAEELARELIRLQDGIEAQRDTCARVATLCRSSIDPDAPAVASNLESVARALTRLLNGDTE